MLNTRKSHGGKILERWIWIIFAVENFAKVTVGMSGLERVDSTGIQTTLCVCVCTFLSGYLEIPSISTYSTQRVKGSLSSVCMSEWIHIHEIHCVYQLVMGREVQVPSHPTLAGLYSVPGALWQAHASSQSRLCLFASDEPCAQCVQSIPTFSTDSAVQKDIPQMTSVQNASFHFKTATLITIIFEPR